MKFRKVTVDKPYVTMTNENVVKSYVIMRIEAATVDTSCVRMRIET